MKIRRKKSELAALAKTLFLKKESGARVRDLAKSYGVHENYAHNIIQRYQNGDFDGVEVNSEEMTDLITSKCYLPVEHSPEFIEVFVNSEDDSSNSLLVKIQKPETRDVDEYDLELQKNIIERLSWATFNQKFDQGG